MNLLQFFQFCRRQPGAVQATPDKAAEVARFLKSIGIEQRAELRGNSTITRLYRTDSGAPTYPASPAERRRCGRSR